VSKQKKRPNLLKVKIQDAYFFYKKSFKRTGPFCNSYQMQSMLNLSLSSATIGEHTRHVIEMFQCLLNNYESGVVNYDERARDIVLQTDTNSITQILNIQDSLEKENKKWSCNKSLMIKKFTHYFRELLYNLEHCIHHQR
jgi:hypothetical protein